MIDHVEMCSTEPAVGVQIRTDVLKEVLQHHHHVNSPLSLFHDTFSFLWLHPDPPSSVNLYIHSFHSPDDDAP